MYNWLIVDIYYINNLNYTSLHYVLPLNQFFYFSLKFFLAKQVSVLNLFIIYFGFKKQLLKSVESKIEEFFFQITVCSIVLKFVYCM